MIFAWIESVDGEDANRDSPWPEDTTLPRGLGDVMVRTGVAMHRIIVVIRLVQVAVAPGHVGG